MITIKKYVYRKITEKNKENVTQIKHVFNYARMNNDFRMIQTYIAYVLMIWQFMISNVKADCT